MYYLIRILIGIIPESIFFTLFLIFSKSLKEKRWLLFTLMTSTYILFGGILGYNIWFNIIYTFITYLILRILYKSSLIDIFLFTFSSLILTTLSIICYYSISDYKIALCINRVLMFGILFIFRNKWNKLYTWYCSVWNRNDEAKIKSITIRNASLIIFNVLLFIINLTILTSSQAIRL